MKSKLIDIIVNLLMYASSAGAAIGFAYQAWTHKPSPFAWVWPLIAALFWTSNVGLRRYIDQSDKHFMMLSKAVMAGMHGLAIAIRPPVESAATPMAKAEPDSPAATDESRRC